MVSGVMRAYLGQDRVINNNRRALLAQFTLAKYESVNRPA
jgi:hypothetical protein